MRRLAQFVNLSASCVCVHLSASRVLRLASCVLRLASRVCVHLSASCVCVHLSASRVSRLASGSVCASVCISRLCASRVSRLCASVCVSRLASRVWLSLCVSRLRLCASVCVSRLSHVKGSECSRLSASHVSRLSVLVNACGDWLILCVGRHSKSLKGFCYRHTIYPLAVFCERVLFF